MNTKVVYGAGIVILLIGIVFYFINTGFFSSEKSISPSSSLNVSKISSNVGKSSTPLSSPSHSKSSVVDSKQQPQQGQTIAAAAAAAAASPQKQVSSNYDNLTVSAKSVNILPINNASYLQIALNVHNPNQGAAILETLSYNVYFKNIRLASADIGSKPQGFIDSLSSVYPIIGNQTITLKDQQPLTPEAGALLNSNGTLNTSSNSSSISKSLPKPNFFIINGTLSTTLDRGTQSQSSENPFSLKFPIK
jgi:hypothetical protein